MSEDPHRRKSDQLGVSMRLPGFLVQHAASIVITALLGAMGAVTLYATTTWLDARHVSRVESIDARIQDYRMRINRNDFFNQTGTQTNAPARAADNSQLQTEIERLKDVKERLQ